MLLLLTILHVPSYTKTVPFVTGLIILSLTYNCTTLEEKPKIGNKRNAFLLGGDDANQKQTGKQEQQ